jgi:hypothetical protein
LAQIGKQLGRKALAEIATIVRPETILAWHRRLVPGSSMVRRSEAILVGPRSIERCRISSSGWPRKIATGATTASPGPSPTSATR